MTALFSGYPTYERFRPLKDQVPMLVGEDVFGLQTALSAAGYPCGPFDGWLGPATGKAIWQFQTAQGLVRDGIVGPATNNRLVELLCVPATSMRSLPSGLLFGHIGWESSFYPGQYSPQRAAGDYDAGIAQRNTAHTPAAEGFNAPGSIAALAKNEREYYDLYRGIPGRRRWLLAAGAWNAPAFANRIAYEELIVAYGGDDAARRKAAEQIPWQIRSRELAASTRATLEAYMSAATVLM